MKAIAIVPFLVAVSFPIAAQQDSSHSPDKLISRAAELMQDAAAAGQGTPKAILDYDDAIELLQRAAKLQPTRALSHTMLAQAFISYPSWPKLGPVERMKRGEKEARLAISLDEKDATAHWLLGSVETWSWHWAEARREFLRALEINPNDSTTHFLWVQYLAAAGDIADARSELERARKLFPGNAFEGPVCLWLRDYACTIAAAEHQGRTGATSSYQMGARSAWIVQCSGIAYLMTGRTSEAKQQFQYGVDHTEKDAGSLMFLAYGLAAAKRSEEAEKIVSEVKQRIPHHYVPVYRLAAYYAYLGKTDEAIRWLEMAADSKSPQYDPAWLSLLNIDPLMDPLRHDARFAKLVARIGFPHALSSF